MNQPKEERRAVPRTRTRQSGKALLSDGRQFECEVVDLSERGARLRFDGPVSLPTECLLETGSPAHAMPVQVMWQRGREAGVQFAGELRRKTRH